MRLFFVKQPAEEYSIGFEFEGALPEGTSLAGGTVSATDAAGADVSGTILHTTIATIVGMQASVKVKGGIHGARYKITFSATLNSGDKLEEDVMMVVVDR